MRAKPVALGVAVAALLAGPALAGGPLGMSGNMGGLLGGPGGGHQPNWGGGGKGGQGHGQGWYESSNSNKAFQSNEQTSKSQRSGSQYQESSFKQNDTVLGGVYANPQVEASGLTKAFQASSGGDCGCKGGGGESVQSSTQKKSFSAAFPVAIGETTLGGFESHKASGKTWDNKDYAHSESTAFKASHSEHAGGFKH